MPKLGLAIPPPPLTRSKTTDPLTIPQLSIPGPGTRSAAPPRLSVATPHGTQVAPQVGGRGPGRPQLKLGKVPGRSLTYDGSSDESSRSRSRSRSNDGNNESTSATATSYSALDFAGMLRGSSNADMSAPQRVEEGDETAALDREHSLPDLAKLSLEKGRPLDVEDLDDAGWKAASKCGNIEELGSLGEGAGGAVTKCMLRGGSTIFALKVGLPFPLQEMQHMILTHHRSSLQTPTPTSRNKSFENYLSTRTAHRAISAGTTVPLWTTHTARSASVWNFAKAAL